MIDITTSPRFWIEPLRWWWYHLSHPSCQKGVVHDQCWHYNKNTWFPKMETWPPLFWEVLFKLLLLFSFLNNFLWFRVSIEAYSFCSFGVLWHVANIKQQVSFILQNHKLWQGKPIFHQTKPNATCWTAIKINGFKVYSSNFVLCENLSSFVFASKHIKLLSKSMFCYQNEIW